MAFVCLLGCLSAQKGPQWDDGLKETKACQGLALVGLIREV